MVEPHTGSTEKAAVIRANPFEFAQNGDKHIVDVLIEERCPKLAADWTWPAVRPLLYAVLGYRQARAMADLIAPLNGFASFEALSDLLKVKLDIVGEEHVPASGRMVIAANHPTGLADGVAVFDALKRKRPDLTFFANADAIRVSPRFGEVIIPVEWVQDKRSAAKTRETLRLANEAFAKERCVVLFPSGALATREKGVGLVDRPWHATVVSLARKQNAPLVPMHVRAENSELYYRFSEWSKELRDITLFHELLNKKGYTFGITYGQPIPPERLQGEPQAVTDALKAYIERDLARDSNAVFAGI
jgi:putative hemolysin